MSFTRDPDFAGHRDGVVAGDDLMTPILWSLAAMTAHTLNNLSSPTMPDGEVNPDFNACDPHQCAPCDGLYRMFDLGVLDQFLRPYVKTSGADWDWWVGDVETGHLDWEWVTARTYPSSVEFLDEDEVTTE